MATAKAFIAEYFGNPEVARYQASLSPEELAAFNQGKDCALAIIGGWLADGHSLDPLSMIALDSALSEVVGFTRDGRPLAERLSA